jgi:hypothetical protein
MNKPCRRGFSRRDFLLGTATGLAAAVPFGYFALRDSFTAPATSPIAAPEYLMPGPYPGRVVEVLRDDAVSDDHKINASAVASMIDRGMAELTDTDPSDPAPAWRRFFEKGQVVGIKVNPVGRKPKPDETDRVAGAVGSISSPEVVLHIVKCLREHVGLKPQDIILFERYAKEFTDADYDKLLREPGMEGVRWYASAAAYSDYQVDLAGFDQGRDAFSFETNRHVAGYDRDAFVHMGFCHPGQDPKDDRRFRTHLSSIVTKLVDRVITIPVLKDHRSGGVTLALKNLSHGMNNNVSRSHLGGQAHAGMIGRELPNGPNQCNTFIPTAVAQAKLRQKAALHILDGLIGVYEGGPGSWNKTWATWRYKGLFFATDPVAMDHVGWDIIDTKRIVEGWLPVGETGLLPHNSPTPVMRRLAPLAAQHPLEALTLESAAKNRQEGQTSENFRLRQPEHVILAGNLGLGVFDQRGIEHRRIRLQG